MYRELLVYVTLTFHQTVFAKECPEIDLIPHSRFRIRDLKQGIWFITYKMMAQSDEISIFNDELIKSKYVVLTVTNSERFELSFHCFDKSQIERKVFAASLSWFIAITLMANYSYNELLCNKFKVREKMFDKGSGSLNTLLNIKILHTDYSHELILYNCVNGSESFLFLTREMKEINGVPYYKPPKLPVFQGKEFDLELYLNMTHSNICSNILKPNASAACSESQQKYIFTSEFQSHNKPANSTNMTLTNTSNIVPSRFRLFGGKLESSDEKLSIFRRKLLALFIIVVIPMLMISIDYFFETI